MIGKFCDFCGRNLAEWGYSTIEFCQTGGPVRGKILKLSEVCDTCVTAVGDSVNKIVTELQTNPVLPSKLLPGHKARPGVICPSCKKYEAEYDAMFCAGCSAKSKSPMQEGMK